MFANKSLKRKFLLILFFTAITTLNYFLFAQEKPDGIKKKMDEIKGKVEKITITTSDGQTIFDGEEAEILFELMKFPPHERLAFRFEDFDDSTMEQDLVFLRNHRPLKKMIRIERDSMRDTDLIFLREHRPHDKLIWTDKDPKMFKIKISDSCRAGDELMKKIEIEDGDGVKKVTVTTTENGEEKMEVYEGEDAERYLEKLHGNKNFILEFDAPHPPDRLMWLDENFKEYRLEKMGDKKIVKVTIENDETKVTITTFEDGEEKVEVLEGENAEKWLNENEVKNLQICPEEKCIKVKVDKEKVIIDSDEDGKMEKKIIIIEK